MSRTGSMIPAATRRSSSLSARFAQRVGWGTTAGKIQPSNTTLVMNIRIRMRITGEMSMPPRLGKARS